MNTWTIVALVAALAAASAAPSTVVVQGPSAKSTVVGADGSVIWSVAPGGRIVAEEHPGVVAPVAPVVPSVVSSYAHSPIVSTYAHVPVFSAYSAPVFSGYAHAPVVSAYSAPVIAAHGVVAHSAVDTVVAGPSGTIATSKTVATPAVVAAAHGVHAYAPHGLYI